MSDKFKLGKFFGLDEDDEDDVDDVKPSEPKPAKAITPPNQKVVSIQSKQSQASKIAIFEPRIYADAKQIAGGLVENNAAIVNFTHTDSAAIARIIDFLSGVVFTIDGNTERIGNRIFLFTPHKFEIDGDVKRGLGNQFK